MVNYDEKHDAYFGRPRYEIARFLPKRAERVLEIGCGRGQTLKWLKESGVAGETFGMELMAPQGAVAREVVDHLLVGDAEKTLETHYQPAQFDLVLCLDVLEHMLDPWAFVSRVEALLKPGGLLICSVPNVRHYSVVMSLLFGGRWQYSEEGILDQTHLRFFTRSSLSELAGRGGLSLEACVPNMYEGSRLALINKITGGVFAEFMALQYLTLSRKRG